MLQEGSGMTQAGTRTWRSLLKEALEIAFPVPCGTGKAGMDIR